MLVSDIPEFLLYPVEDRGVPNTERIAIRVQQHVDMGKYGIMIGHANHDGSAIPYYNYLFWFGDGTVNPGDWVILHTGQGEAKTSDWHEPGTKIYSLHWGMEKTIFANTNIVPIIFRIDGVEVGKTPMDVPQLNQA